jgi:hypothetical protein
MNEEHAMTNMLAGFALYREDAAQPPWVSDTGPIGDPNTISTPIGTRLMRIIRLEHSGWRLWTATRDFRHGTYLELLDDGRIYNCTVRPDEGDDIFMVRPRDNP